MTAIRRVARLPRARVPFVLLAVLGLLLAGIGCAAASTVDSSTPIGLRIAGNHLEFTGPVPTLNWQRLAPGFSSTLSVSVRNDTGTAAALSMGTDDVSDRPGPGGSGLASLLVLSANEGPAWQATVAQASHRSSPTLLVVPANSSARTTLRLSLPGSVDNRAQGASAGFALTFDTSLSTGAVSLPVQAGADTSGPSTWPATVLAWTGASPLAAILIGFGLLAAGLFVLINTRRTRSPQPEQP